MYLLCKQFLIHYTRAPTRKGFMIAGSRPEPVKHRARMVALTALTCALTLLCLTRAGAAQEQPAPSPIQEYVTDLALLESRIAESEARYVAAEGQNREVFFHQFRRRWREHHDVLDGLVAEIVRARDAGEEDPEVVTQARAAVDREIRTILTWLGIIGDSIAALRRDHASSPTIESLESEIELTELGARFDRGLSSLAADYEHAGILGLDVTGGEAVLDSVIVDRAALLAAQLELTLEQRTTFQERRSKPGVDTVALATQLAVMEERLLGTTTSLDLNTELMDRRGMETTAYRQLLLTATGDFGTDLLNPSVVGGVLSGWVEEVLEWFRTNTGTIFVRLMTILLILLSARLLARLGRRGMSRVLSSGRVKVSELLKKLALGATSKLIWLIGFLAALSVLGIDIGPMLAGLGLLGFVLGFALQDTLSNFAVGMMIMIYRPFDVDDLVTVGGVHGTVKDLTLVNTVITTLDNQRIVVPNGKVWSDVINNATAERIRRVDLVFGIGYEDDIQKAKRILDEILASNDLVLEDPEPVVRVHTLGESSVDFVCRPWCRTDDYWDVHWSVTESVKQRFDAEGVSIPFPQQDVHVHASGIPSQPGEPTPASPAD